MRLILIRTIFQFLLCVQSYFLTDRISSRVHTIGRCGIKYSISTYLKYASTTTHRYTNIKHMLYIYIYMHIKSKRYA